jgi:hypothetical protein
VIIVEDDPYFFLQEGLYIPKSRRANSNNISTGDEESYVSSLEPSFLKYYDLLITSLNVLTGFYLEDLITKVVLFVWILSQRCVRTVPLKYVDNICNVFRQLLLGAAWAGSPAVLCSLKGSKGKEVSLIPLLL